MELLHKRVDNSSIVLTLEDRSIVELSRDDSLAELLLANYKLVVKNPIFFFNRIKVIKEGEGRGSFLMREIAEIADFNSVNIVNMLNPYGKLKLTALIKFNEKFGFELIDRKHKVMLRRAIN